MEEKILGFLKTIESLKSTLRHNWIKSGRQESSAEHAWRVAIFFIVVKDLFELDVDFEKIIKMVLIHDIPELVDGDIPGFVKEKNEKQHVENEIANAKKVFGRLPSPLDKKYTELFTEFEEGETYEAKVAKALDRIESQLQHLESGPKYWCEEEKGKHMLNYPNEALRRLDNKNVSRIWDIIKEEIEKVNEEIGVK